MHIYIYTYNKNNSDQKGRAENTRGKNERGQQKGAGICYSASAHQVHTVAGYTCTGAQLEGGKSHGKCIWDLSSTHSTRGWKLGLKQDKDQQLAVKTSRGLSCRMQRMSWNTTWCKLEPVERFCAGVPLSQFGAHWACNKFWKVQGSPHERICVLVLIGR